MLHLDQKQKYLYSIEKLIVLKGSKDDFYNVAIGKAQYITTDADLFPFFGDFDKVPYKQQYLDIYNNIAEAKRRNHLIKELKVSYDNYLDAKKFELQKKHINVIFIEGRPGSGKSAFAVYLAKKNNKTYCISSSSNDILQDYTCEEYLILDDLRDDVFSFTDLLKLLDNHVISSIKSRYKNKVFLGDTIIITSNKPLHHWYIDIDEDKTQLYRRINLFAFCIKEPNRLVANVYVPNFCEDAVNRFGCPNGHFITVPFLDLNENDLYVSSENLWLSLGVNINNVEN